MKIILFGTSWGSALGTKMVLQRPNLFHAYIGHSQIVNFSRSLDSGYNTVKKLSITANDQDAINKLAALGPPPYSSAKNAGQLLRIIKKYESKRSVPAPETWWELVPEYDNEIDSKYRYDGDDYSFIHFVGHEKLEIESMMSNIDFMKDGLDFKIPVYLIQGENDILTPREITKEYFDKISAPKKEFFLLPEAAHGFNQSVVDTAYEIMKEYL